MNDIIFFLVVSSDYDCLITMNTASLDKYKQMHRTLERVNNSIRTINDSNSKIYFIIYRKRI
jgi:hypothetical protein